MDNILIVLLGALGDVTRGFSVLKPIKDRYPNVKISWLVEPRCKGIVALHSLVDEIIVFDRNSPLKGLMELRKELAKREFDVTLDLQRHFKSGFFSYLSGSKKRVGFNKKNAKEFNWIFNTDHIFPVSKDVSKVYHYQEFLDVIDVPKFDKPDFSLEVTEEDIPYRLLPNCSSENKFCNGINGRFGLVLGSQWPTKDWFEDSYVDLVKGLVKDYPDHEIVLIGDKTTVELSENIVAKSNGNKLLLNTVGKTNLRELLGVLNVCSLVVGPDSGPAHISSALEKPYITLFGPTEIDRVVAFGCRDYVVTAGLSCSPCMKRKCPALDKACMQLITPKMVLNKVAEVVSL